MAQTIRAPSPPRAQTPPEEFGLKIRFKKLLLLPAWGKMKPLSKGKYVYRDVKAIWRYRGVRLPAQPSNKHPIQKNTAINI